MTQRRSFDLGDYIEVHERIAAFKAAHPEGSLQSEIHMLNDSVVVMKAMAYRTPDDPRPGIGFSSLGIPGSTPYTKGSEIENCETSAWGRAIAALGFEVKRGIASRDEVANKQGETGQRSFAKTNTAKSAPPWADALQGALADRGLALVDVALVTGSPTTAAIQQWLDEQRATAAQLADATLAKKQEAVGAGAN